MEKPVGLDMPFEHSLGNSDPSKSMETKDRLNNSVDYSTAEGPLWSSAINFDDIFSQLCGEAAVSPFGGNEILWEHDKAVTTEDNDSESELSQQFKNTLCCGKEDVVSSNSNANSTRIPETVNTVKILSNCPEILDNGSDLLGQLFNTATHEDTLLAGIQETSNCLEYVDATSILDSTAVANSVQCVSDVYSDMECSSFETPFEQSLGNSDLWKSMETQEIVKSAVDNSTTEGSLWSGAMNMKDIFSQLCDEEAAVSPFEGNEILCEHDKAVTTKDNNAQSESSQQLNNTLCCEEENVVSLNSNANAIKTHVIVNTQEDLSDNGSDLQGQLFNTATHESPLLGSIQETSNYLDNMDAITISDSTAVANSVQREFDIHSDMERSGLEMPFELSLGNSGLWKSMETQEIVKSALDNSTTEGSLWSGAINFDDIFSQLCGEAAVRPFGGNEILWEHDKAVTTEDSNTQSESSQKFNNTSYCEEKNVVSLNSNANCISIPKTVNSEKIVPGYPEICDDDPESLFRYFNTVASSSGCFMEPLFLGVLDWETDTLATVTSETTKKDSDTSRDDNRCSKTNGPDASEMDPPPLVQAPVAQELLFICSICYIGFNSRAAWKQHILKDHDSVEETNEKENICVNLKSSIAKQDEEFRLLPASKTSKHNKSHGCKFPGCRKKFSSEESLQIHSLCHSTDYTFQCFVCDSPFGSWHKCTKHLWDKHNIDCELLSCPYCLTYKTVSLGALNTHQQIHRDVRSFVCPDCGKTFKQSAQLRNHRITHLVHEGGDVPQWRAKKQCDICSKIYSSSKTLKAHIEIVHSKRRPFLCKVCGDTFPRKATLELHIRQHTGEKPFSCSLCDYRATDRNTLRRHTMKHTGQRPYKCPHCPYSAVQSSMVKVHLRSKHPEACVV